ncbi:MAG: tail fiber protein [bacterium]
MADPYLSEIRMFAGDFAPSGWLPCDGRLLSVAENQALFSLIGTIYGGDGRQTFALPDLRARAPVGDGRGNGLTQRQLGEAYGVSAVTLLPNHIPAHTHGLVGSGAPATSPKPDGALPAVGPDPAYSAAASTTMAGGLDPVGGGMPHENRPPMLGVGFIIAVVGVFPGRA